MCCNQYKPYMQCISTPYPYGDDPLVSNCIKLSRNHDNHTITTSDICRFYSMLFYCWTLRNEFRWNFIVNTNIVIWENAFEMFVCRMAAILSLPQCIRQKTAYIINRFGHHRNSYSGTVPLTSSILNHTTNGSRVQSRHSWNPRAHFMLWILYVEWNYVGYSEISCCLTDQTYINYIVPCYLLILEMID